MKKLIQHNSLNKSLTVNTKLAVATFFILILTSLISVISIATSAQSDINRNTDTIFECKTNIGKTSEEIKNIETRLTAIEIHYEHIEESLNRIEDKLK